MVILIIILVVVFLFAGDKKLSKHKQEYLKRKGKRG